MASRWLPVIAVTASRWLRAELLHVEQEAGCEFEYTDSIPEGRRHARRRPLIIVGADLAGRIRKPLSCGGLIVVATVNPPTPQTFVHAERIGTTYVVALPVGRPWLANHIAHDVPKLMTASPTRPPASG